MNNVKRHLINDIQEYGHSTIVDNKETKELVGFQFSVNNDEEIFLTDEDRSYIEKKIQEVRKDIDRCKVLLHKDRNSRQAIIPFLQDIKIPNCFVSINLLIRDDEVYCFCYSRSLDVKNKLECDIDICRRICSEICEEFDANLKLLKFIVGSLHYYAKDN